MLSTASKTNGGKTDNAGFLKLPFVFTRQLLEVKGEALFSKKKQLAKKRVYRNRHTLFLNMKKRKIKLLPPRQFH
jgi:hypothetical protein